MNTRVFAFQSPDTIFTGTEIRDTRESNLILRSKILEKFFPVYALLVRLRVQIKVIQIGSVLFNLFSPEKYAAEFTILLKASFIRRANRFSRLGLGTFVR